MRAGSGCDDPAVWEAVSPYWDAQRAEEMAEVGSPGFAEQWLNVWPDASDVGRWLPGVGDAGDGRAGWGVGAGCGGVWVGVHRRTGAVGGGCGVAASRRSRCGRGCGWWGRAAEAWLVLGARQGVGASGGGEAGGDGRRGTVEHVNVSIGRAATTELRDVVLSGVLTVAGVPDEQWAGVRTVPADGGEMIYAPKSLGMSTR